jgi:hypothetical protein
MRQRWQWILGGLAIFAVGFYAGGFFGAHRAMMAIEPVMRSEVAASIGFEIDELIFLRTGNPDKALRRMEWRLDAAILGVAGVRPSQELSTGDRQALQLAKKYRDRYPYAAADPEAQAFLSALPDGPLDPMIRKTAARVLLEPAPAAASVP